MWTVHINLVNHVSGARSAKSATAKFSVSLPSGALTTIQDFLKIINEQKSSKFSNQLAIRDLQPFDESTLGHQTSQHRMHRDPGFVSKWVPAVENPRPINCSWKPDVADPTQTIEAAGLCDGAELCHIQRSLLVG